MTRGRCAGVCSGRGYLARLRRPGAERGDVRRPADRRAAADRPGRDRRSPAVHAGWHTALYGLGRLEEADEVYRTIERLCPAMSDGAPPWSVRPVPSPLPL